jgi:hypothetical protein
MTPEEKAEMRRHEKELTEKILARKRAVSAEWNALKTDEERRNYYKDVDDYCRERGFNVVSRRSSL